MTGGRRAAPPGGPAGSGLSASGSERARLVGAERVGWWRTGRTLVALRWPLVVGWIALAVWMAGHLPALSTTGGTDLEAFLPPHAAALAVARQAADAFGVPLSGEAVVVTTAGSGRSLGAAPFALAAGVDAGVVHVAPALAGALPLAGGLDLTGPAARVTSVVATELVFVPGTSSATATTVAATYGRLLTRLAPQDHVAVGGVTAELDAEENVVGNRLTELEVVVVGLVVVVIGLAYRSVVAPAVVLGTAAVAFVVATKLLAVLAAHHLLRVPAELEPLIVVLLLGVVTDYCVFFLSERRSILGRERVRPSELAVVVALVVPLVVGAGLTVALGTLTLALADQGIFQALGPGLGLAVGVAAIVAATLVPAFLGVLGRLVFWPASGGSRGGETHPGGQPKGARRRERLARLLVRRPVGVLVVLVVLAGVIWPTGELGRLTEGVDLGQGLPAGVGAARAGRLVAPLGRGWLAPTVIVMTGRGLSVDPARLVALQRAISETPGVAGVLGPASLRPIAERLPVFVGAGRGRLAGVGTLPAELTTSFLRLFVAPDGEEARFVVGWRAPPLSAEAIGDLSRLERELPRLAARAGFGQVAVKAAGATALAGDVVADARSSLERVSVGVLVVNLVVLSLLLGSVLAPLLAVMASAVVVLVALGLATWAVDRLAPGRGLTFYVPLAVIVLLISFGADYNLFVVGRIWEASTHRPLRQAIAEAGTEASGAVSVAGATLALSFAALALVGVGAFVELALSVAVGVLLDTYFVRPVLLPALLGLADRVAWWPRHSRGPVP